MYNADLFFLLSIFFDLVYGENQENALDAVEKNGKYEFTITRKPRKRTSNSSSKRPKSYRSGSKSAKGI